MTDPGRLVRRIPKAARGLKAQRRAYARTLYRAGAAEGRIGRRSASLEALLAGWGMRRGSFLTAWNPWGRFAGAALNARLQARLEGETRRIPRSFGDCGDAGWAERTLFLGAHPDRVAALGRKYRQAAVVHAVRGRPLRLAYWPMFHTAPRGR
jgi:hypothetical protein